MLFTVTRQEASAVEYAHIFILQVSRRWVGTHDGDIEVYQVAVVESCSLGGANAVRVVTSRAWNFLT